MCVHDAVVPGSSSIRMTQKTSSVPHETDGFSTTLEISGVCIKIVPHVHFTYCIVHLTWFGFFLDSSMLDRFDIKAQHCVMPRCEILADWPPYEHPQMFFKIGQPWLRVYATWHVQRPWFGTVVSRLVFGLHCIIWLVFCMVCHQKIIWDSETIMILAHMRLITNIIQTNQNDNIRERTIQTASAFLQVKNTVWIHVLLFFVWRTLYMWSHVWCRFCLLWTLQYVFIWIALTILYIIVFWIWAPHPILAKQSTGAVALKPFPCNPSMPGSVRSLYFFEDDKTRQHETSAVELLVGSNGRISTCCGKFKEYRAPVLVPGHHGATRLRRIL